MEQTHTVLNDPSRFFVCCCGARWYNPSQEKLMLNLRKVVRLEERESANPGNIGSTGYCSEGLGWGWNCRLKKHWQTDHVGKSEAPVGHRQEENCCAAR